MRQLDSYKMRLVLIGTIVSSFWGINSICLSVEYIWTDKADIPTPRMGHTSAMIHGKIYVFGGSTSEPDDEVLSSVEEYDPITNTWTKKADMPIATSQMGSIVFGNKIFVIGGWDWSQDFPYAAVQIYDPETDMWTIEGDAPFLRSGFSAEVVNKKIYAIGGTDRPHPCPAMSTVYEFGPFLDFNWDGIVDSPDMCKLIDHWQTDNPLYDIAPLPYGDGIVDVQDLIELSEHLFQEVSSLALIGHWRLDEDEGDIAYNNTSDNHGILSGEPIWQTDDGQIAGALEFDGIDDYIITEPILNPADGVFSVIVWIKGGVPGQDVLAQVGGSNWLCIDSEEGCLMTELKSFGRGAPGPLLSQTIITDGKWHRIALVWDGSYRHLYVDGVEAAMDATPLSGLESAEGDMYFGVDSTLTPGSFFSGLIDDIRIYNRVVSP